MSQAAKSHRREIVHKLFTDMSQFMQALSGLLGPGIALLLMVFRACVARGHIQSLRKGP